MRIRLRLSGLAFLATFLCFASSTRGEDVKDTKVYARLTAYLDAVSGIDTHSHLVGPRRFKGGARREPRADKPTDCALRRLWGSSYFIWGHPLAPWPADGKFETWWAAASNDFADSRARSAYRSLLPVFQDLYGVDFDTITLEQARDLNERMEQNIENPDWANEVLRRRANTELIVVDCFTLESPSRRNSHPFQYYACNVRRVIDGFHPSELKAFPGEDPYAFAARRGIPIHSLDDYVAVLDRIVAEAKKNGAVCLKNQMAYYRTLQVDRVPKNVAEQAFGKTRSELTPVQIKAFEDYVFWRLAALSAKHEMPLQIHTGHAQVPGSNPMNLVKVIEGNPQTRFILLHGGFPWVGEAGMVALKYPNVWIDSVWLPTLSHAMGKRAIKEWLDMFSSNRIMWGSDTSPIEVTYGLTMFTRQCITEALAEKVLAKELREEDAKRIGRQILRENALEAMPLLRKHLENRATKQ